MPPTRWLTRLSVQVTAVITIATAIGGGLFLWLVLRSQERLLMEQTVRQAAFFSDTLLNSLQRHMLRNERSDLDATLTAVVKQPRMTELRLFDATGRTAFSNRASEIGRVADMTEPTCRACHRAGHSPGPLDAAARSRVIDHPNGRMLATDAGLQHRDLLHRRLPRAPGRAARARGARSRRVAVGGRCDARGPPADDRLGGHMPTIAGLALATAIVFTRRQVGDPIAQLASAIAEAGRIPGAGRHPRLGRDSADLAHAFNDMASVLLDARRQRLALLESLERQVEERTAALESARAKLLQTEKLSSLGRLSASIAHEIKQPARGGILTYAKLLIRTLEQGDADPATRARAGSPPEADRAGRRSAAR